MAPAVFAAHVDDMDGNAALSHWRVWARALEGDDSLNLGLDGDPVASLFLGGYPDVTHGQVALGFAVVADADRMAAAEVDVLQQRGAS